MKWSNLKGTRDFSIGWFILVMYSGVMLLLGNIELGIFGFILTWVLGCIGFDMIGDVVDKIKLMSED